MRTSVLALVLAAGAAGAEETQPRLGVFDFQANGVSREAASALTGVAANELQRLGVFKVVTSEMIRELLSLERQKQLVGCQGESCASEIASTIGMDFLVTGKVSKVGGGRGIPVSYSVELTLLRVKTSTREGSDIQMGQSEADLMGKVNRSVLKLVSKILQGRTGALVVTASERGASVKVDDTLVGTTPLMGKLSLAAGPHLLMVEKEGFVAVQKEVRIQADQTVEETVSLVPSPDFIAHYERSQARMRLGAYIATGASAAGVATFVAFQARANGLYGTPNQQGTFDYYRTKVVAGQEVEGDVDNRQQATALKGQIESSQVLSYVGLGVAAAAAVTAGYFWIAGDDPNRYGKYREIRVSLGGAPLPGGGLAQLGLQF